MDKRPTRDTCLWCGESLWFEDLRLGNIFCSRKCKNAEFYRRRQAPRHRQLYLKSKQRWKVSNFGVSMHHWWNKMKDFQ